MGPKAHARAASDECRLTRHALSEARRSAAKHISDKNELKVRIEELERLLHVAIESSCSKEDMTHSYHALRNMESQRMRVVEAGRPHISSKLTLSLCHRADGMGLLFIYATTRQRLHERFHVVVVEQT